MTSGSAGYSPRMATAARTRVLLVDANTALRQIVAELLADEPDFDVVGQAGEAREALDAVAAGRVDLVLIGENLPDVPGSAVLPRLKEARPQVITALWTPVPTLEGPADICVYRGATFRQLLRGLRLAVRTAPRVTA